MARIIACGLISKLTLSTFMNKPINIHLWLIINPYGEVMWNVRRAPLLARWNEIKREIKA